MFTDCAEEPRATLKYLHMLCQKSAKYKIFKI